MTVKTSITLICDKTGDELNLKAEDGKKLTAAKARAIALKQHRWTCLQTWDEASQSMVELDLSPEGQKLALAGAGIEIKSTELAPQDPDEDDTEEVEEDELVEV